METKKQIDLLSAKIEENNRLIILLEKENKEEQLKNILRTNDFLVLKRRKLIIRMNSERAA